MTWRDPSRRTAASRRRAAPLDAQGSGPTRAPTEGAAESAPLGQILVVDDNDANARLLCDYLVSCGYAATMAHDGAGALAALDTAQPAFDAVLLDVMMPGLSGRDVLGEIRARPELAGLPVIMVSAKDEATEIASVLKAGADDYISKPVDLTVLRARLGAHIARRQSQARLAQAEEFLRDLTDNLPGGVYRMVAAPGEMPRFVHMSEGLHSLLADLDVPMPHEPRDLIRAGPGQEQRRTSLAAAIDTSRTSLMQLHTEICVHSENPQVWLETRAAPRMQADGRVAWTGLVVDISARKRAEAASDRFRAALNAVRDMIALIEPARMRYSYVNQGMIDLTGYNEATLLDLRATDLAELAGGNLHDALSAVSAGRQAATTFEGGLRRADGTVLPVEYLFQRVRMGDGSPVIVQIGRDIRQRRAATDALQASEERLRAIFDTVPVGFLVLDSGAHVLAANPASEAMFHRDGRELANMPVATLMDPASAPRVWSDLRALARDGRDPTEGRGRELTALRADGSRFPVHVHWAAWHHDDWYYTAILRDLTEEKRIQAALHQAQKMEAVGQLTGGIAHDFNNLLAVVLGNIELLHEDLADRPQAQARLKRIHHGAERGSQLTQRLLAFSRRQPLQPRSIDLNEAVTSMQDLIASSLGETVQVATQLAGNLPHVRVDPGQLENVLLNLAINARDAMPDGGHLTLATGVAQPGDKGLPAGSAASRFATVSVTDTGTGMTEDAQARAFEPFFTTKAAGEGSGLGLSSVYGFARQSGGYVTLESTRGEGTRVTLFLPIAETAAQAMPEPERAPAAEVRGHTVLVVEDNDQVRGTVVHMLAELGCPSVEAADGTAALALLDRGERVDILLTDVVLANGPHGPALADAARRRRPNLPVAFMTGYSPRDQALTQDGSPLNAPWVSKPFHHTDLADALGRALVTGDTDTAS